MLSLILLFPLSIPSASIPERCDHLESELVMKRGGPLPMRSTQSSEEPRKVNG